MNNPVHSPSCGLRLVSIIAGLASLAHLARLFLGFQIMIGSHAVPVWCSGIALIVLGLLSFWFWKLSTLVKPAATDAPPPPAPAAT